MEGKKWRNRRILKIVDSDGKSLGKYDKEERLVFKVGFNIKKEVLSF